MLLLGAALLPAVSAATFDEAARPGKNYDKAEFRLWYPDEAASLAATVILVPGSNGDGRSSVDDPVWRAFATKHRLALVGCRFTDKPHEQSFIEEYANVSQGSGQALLDTMAVFARVPSMRNSPALRSCYGECRPAVSSTTNSWHGRRRG